MGTWQEEKEHRSITAVSALTCLNHSPETCSTLLGILPEFSRKETFENQDPKWRCGLRGQGKMLAPRVWEVISDI